MGFVRRRCWPLLLVAIMTVQLTLRYRADVAWPVLMVGGSVAGALALTAEWYLRRRDTARAR